MTLQPRPSIFRFALCALVCMLALQTWEAGHSHELGVAQVECQVCSSPADTVLPATAAVPPALANSHVALRAPLTRGAITPFFSFQSRGPPAIS